MCGLNQVMLSDLSHVNKIQLLKNMFVSSNDKDDQDDQDDEGDGGVLF